MVGNLYKITNLNHFNINIILNISLRKHDELLTSVSYN